MLNVLFVVLSDRVAVRVEHFRCKFCNAGRRDHHACSMLADTADDTFKTAGDIDKLNCLGIVINLGVFVVFLKIR